MTDIKELFSGIGVVIDEKINEDTRTPNGIQKIISSLKENHIPLLEFRELPDEFVKQFHSISFLILDWNLSGTDDIPQATIDDNIDFLKQLHKVCYVPVFIFSDESIHDIEVALYTHDIDCAKKPIFIKKKNEVDTADKLFTEITNWLKNTPPAYLLKEWEKANREAKTEMLWALTDAHPAWPRVLMNTIKEDGWDQKIELVEMLQNNLNYRITYPNLDIDLIDQQSTEGITKDELRKILECERFIPRDSIPSHPFAGDIYILNEYYYLNIRPDCDIIRDAKKNNKDMYLLRGEIVNEAQINAKEKNSITFDSGEFIEKKHCCYIAFVKGKILQFSLRELYIRSWNEIKDQRIGRLLPPYITRVQQKYAHYLQRQGLPSIPKQAIIVDNNA